MECTEKSGAIALPFILLTMLLLMGCAAKMRPPTDLISEAEMTIMRARKANAINFAPLDLKYAEEKIAIAKKEMVKENYEKSYQLAQDALLDAQAAEAKSNAAEAKGLSKKMEETIKTLKQEIERTP